MEWGLKFMLIYSVHHPVGPLYDIAGRRMQSSVSDYLHQGGYVIVVVCLSVRNFPQKLANSFA